MKPSRRLRLAAVVAPALLLGAFVVGGVSVLHGLEASADAARAGRAAEAVRADLSGLAAMENAAQAGEAVEPAELDVVLDHLSRDLSELLPSLEDADRLGFVADVQTYKEVATATARGFSVGDESAERFDAGVTDPLYARLVADADAVRTEAGGRLDRAQAEARRGLLVAFAGALATCVAVGGIEMRRRTRRARSDAGAKVGRRFQALIEQSHDHVYVVSPSGEIEFMSPAARRWVGRTLHRVDELVSQIDPAAVDQVVAGEGDAAAVPELFVTVGDRSGWFEVHYADHCDDPDVRGFVVTAHEVTDSVELRERLRRQATVDELTGLRNRRAIVDAATEALARGRRSGRAPVLYLVDLDGFKGVNDTLGHPVGDQLLRQVADRLVAATRSIDAVGRLGGDEFAVVAEDVGGQGLDLALAERIIDALAEPFAVEDQLLAMSASIGIAVGDDDVDRLFRYADIALYEAKRAGRNRARRFVPEMETMLVLRNRLTVELEPAFAAGEFSLVYQPVVELAGSRTSGFEALMRWRSSALGDVPPSTFIPLAEQSGAIVEMGRWALREACSQVATWQVSLGDPTLWVSVNVSPVQLSAPEFPDHVRSALEAAGVSAASLQIEVTESVLIDDPARAFGALEAVRALGVRVALDDFGTGYSSMSQLRKMPIDCLKIDRSFVEGLTEGDARSGRVLQALVELGRALDLSVVAEGVETADQLEALREPGCDLVQGFHLARPLDPSGVLAFLSTGAMSGAGAGGGEAQNTQRTRSTTRHAR